MKNIIIVVRLVFLVLFAAACSSDNKVAADAPVVHEIDAATDHPLTDCFQGTPANHDQLINACVDQSVTRIVKYPDLAALRVALPKLNADGSLPPLP